MNSNLPTLPKSLLDVIGEYGMARTDKVSPIEVQHRWELLIAGIKDYAASVATQPPQDERRQGDCGNAECGWRGPISECSYLGSVGPCCPKCREIVEPSTPPQPVAAEGLTGDSLIRSAQALLNLDADGALVPHGIGGHARTIIQAFINQEAMK